MEELQFMEEAKNTARALVRIGYDGTVHKFFRAKDAEQRFENEIRVLKYLEQRGCEFVPRVLSFDRDKLELVTSNCGARVEQLSDERLKELFQELESFGVRHDDPFLRNITYRAKDGRFCIIDFEFATILDEQATLEPVAAGDKAAPQGITGEGRLGLRWSGSSDRGKYRPNNEDEYLAVAFNPAEFIYLASKGEVPTGDFDYVFAVSDGMGGERSGEFASKFALDNITRLMSRRYQFSPAHNRSGIKDCLEDLFQGIHRQLTTLGQSYDEGRNMGATLSMLWYSSGWFYFGHIGDSRIYHLPKAGGIIQLTEDHTHVGWLRRNGQLNEREARNHPRKNVLAQALGAGNQFVRPHLGDVRCEVGDRFLLCTDGVVEGLWDRALDEMVREAGPGGAVDSSTIAQRIVQAATEESGRDNSSAVVVEVCHVPGEDR
ncbi:protein phosphatase 2C domain-containing protein [Planctomicrobium sp. SH664]|uniref:protein phosphatase 2C domain-containing protein n=1 Tax=Planctomicrobium sp. SH664 TaxID=3448125 RepID=UPI003F5BD513